MIEFGMVTPATVVFAAPRVAKEIHEHGCMAVFIDPQRNLRALAHHAGDFEGMVQRRARDLIGVYTAHSDYSRGRTNRWPLAEDMAARLAELSTDQARAA